MSAGAKYNINILNLFKRPTKQMTSFQFDFNNTNETENHIYKGKLVHQSQFAAINQGPDYIVNLKSDNYQI